MKAEHMRACMHHFQVLVLAAHASKQATNIQRTKIENAYTHTVCWSRVRATFDK